MRVGSCGSADGTRYLCIGGDSSSSLTSRIRIFGGYAVGRINILSRRADRWAEMSN